MRQTACRWHSEYRVASVGGNPSFPCVCLWYNIEELFPSSPCSSHSTVTDRHRASQVGPHLLKRSCRIPPRRGRGDSTLVTTQMIVATLATLGSFLAADASVHSAAGRAGSVTMSTVARNPNLGKLQGEHATAAHTRAARDAQRTPPRPDLTARPRVLRSGLSVP